jgi:hypothetical protein
LKRKSLEGWLSKILPLDLSFDGLTQEDVDSALLEHRPIPLLFGRVSAESIIADLRALGLEARLGQRGYAELRAEIAQLPMGQEGLRVSALHAASGQRLWLMDLKAFWGRLPLPRGSAAAECRALVWDWLELRDPRAEFSAWRPPLPGQSAPGLAMFGDLVRLMRDYVARTEAEALVTIPQYFHNAVLYHKAPGLQYRFLDALRQGELRAQMRDLVGGKGLHSAAWAFAENRVEMLPSGADQASGWKAYPWTPSELVLPLTPWVREALERPDPAEREGLEHRFRIRATPHPDLEGSFHLAGP